MPGELLPESQLCVDQAVAAVGAVHASMMRVHGRRVLVACCSEASSSCRSVALVSGGGAGHEPAHGGFVGAGMLSAAVSGDVFASPSASAVVSAVEAALQQLEFTRRGSQPLPQSPPPRSALLIVKNYTGDRLNFCAAMERLRARGERVQMVVVADDCATVPVPASAAPYAGDAATRRARRGVAGTVLVHKMAGAAAAAGYDLSQVTNLAQKLADNLVSISFCFSSSSVGTIISTSDDRSVDETQSGDGVDIQLGKGIHGEAGVCCLCGVKSTSSLVSSMLEHMLSGPDCFPAVANPSASRFVLLVNNLGALSGLQMQIFLAESLRQLAEVWRIRVERVVYGTLMSSLNGPGGSLTLLNLSRTSQQLQEMMQHRQTPQERQCQELQQQHGSTECQQPTSMDLEHDERLSPPELPVRKLQEHQQQAVSDESIRTPVLQRQQQEEQGECRQSTTTRLQQSQHTLTMNNWSVEGLIALLEAPTSAPAWPGVFVPATIATHQCQGAETPWSIEALASRPVGHDTMQDIDPALSTRCLEFAARALVSCRRQLDILDGSDAGGDGDCGSTLASGASLSLQALSSGRLSVGHRSQLLLQLSIVWDSVGGTSGALYSAALAAAAAANSDGWRQCLAVACETVRRYGGAKVGDRTLLDALLAAESAGCDLADSTEQMVAAAEAAEAAAAATTTMVARVGRASFAAASQRQAMADPGAHAVGIWMRAFAEAAKLHRNAMLN